MVPQGPPKKRLPRAVSGEYFTAALLQALAETIVCGGDFLTEGRDSTPL